MKADATPPSADFDLGPLSDSSPVQESVQPQRSRRLSRSKKLSIEQQLQEPVPAPESGAEQKNNFDLFPVDRSLTLPVDSDILDGQSEDSVLDAGKETGKKLTKWLGDTFSKIRRKKAEGGEEAVKENEFLNKGREVLLRIKEQGPKVVLEFLKAKQTYISAGVGLVGTTALALVNPELAHQFLAWTAPIRTISAISAAGFATLEAASIRESRWGNACRLIRMVSADVAVATTFAPIGGVAGELLHNQIGNLHVFGAEPAVTAQPGEPPAKTEAPPAATAESTHPVAGGVTEVHSSATSSPTTSTILEPTTTHTPTVSATPDVHTPTATVATPLGHPGETTQIPSETPAVEPSSSAIPGPTETGSAVQPTAAAESGIASSTPLATTEADALPTATNTPVPTLIGQEPTGTLEAISGTEATPSEAPAVETATLSPLPTETVIPEVEIAPGGEISPAEVLGEPSEGDVGLPLPDLTPELPTETPLHQNISHIPGDYSHIGRDHWEIADNATALTATEADLSTGGRNILTDALGDVMHGPNITSEVWQEAAAKINVTVQHVDRYLLTNSMTNLDFHNTGNDARIDAMLKDAFETHRLDQLLTSHDLRSLQAIAAGG